MFGAGQDLVDITGFTALGQWDIIGLDWDRELAKQVEQCVANGEIWQITLGREQLDTLEVKHFVLLERARVHEVDKVNVLGKEFALAVPKLATDLDNRIGPTDDY